MATTRSTRLSCDVAVVGGGVAGSTVAAALACAGLGVVLVEREARFKDRARGESAHPWGVKEAQKLGLIDLLRTAGAQPLLSLHVYAERAIVESVSYPAVDPETLGEWAIYHPTLQSTLLQYARDSGVRVLRPARVTRFERGAELRLDVSAEDDSQDYEVRARLLLGADGRQSRARRWAGANAVHDPVHHQVGSCLTSGVGLPDDAVHIAGAPGLQVLVFPQGHGLARPYLLCQSELAEPLRGNGHAAAFLELIGSLYPEGSFDGAAPAGPLVFYPNADIWSDRLYHDRVALLGDAAGASDPSLGHGLSLCFRDARELRDLLTAGSDWDAAMREYERRRRRYYGVIRALGIWRAPLTTEIGPEADARRARARRAALADPDLRGYGRGRITTFGPDGLSFDEATRRHYLGEDLE